MKKITKDTLKIETEFMGTFHKALVTPSFTYFCNYEEGDMNGNTKMYANDTLELFCDNYFAGQDFLRAMIEDEHIFISDCDAKEMVHQVIDGGMREVTDSVGLGDDDSDDEFTVYVNEEDTTFIAISTDHKKVLRYRITKAIKDLTKEEREATLHYRYSNMATDEMQVEFDDLFMEGKHIELIK